VVLLHGLASQRRFWNLVVRRLGGVPVLAIDARGHGDSEQPETGYDLDTVADDIALAVRAAGLTRACVVGHSWGGSVALTLAARHPDLVASVVAIDGGFVEPGRGEPRAEVRRRLEPPQVAVPASDLPGLLADGPMRAFWSDEVAAAVLPLFGVDERGMARARLSFERHMDVVDGLLDVSLDDLLRRVRCPAWLVSCEPVDRAAAGEQSLAWAHAKAMGLERALELLDDARALRWAGAVHDVPLQWPDLVAGLIRSALRESSSEASSGRTSP
jgi:pimeloyl-ACP methyl ester carboxylesterase